MGFLPIQRGDIADRLRRLFGITGSYKGTIDENTSPVVVVQQLDVPPYPLLQRNVQGLLVGGATANGTAPWVSCLAFATFPGVIVVDRIHAVRLETALPTTGNSWLLLLGQRQPNTTVNDFCVDVAGSQAAVDPNFGADPQLSAAGLRSGAVATAGVRGLTIDQRGGSLDSIDLVGPWVIPPNQALTVFGPAESDGVSTALIAVSFYGRAVADRALAQSITGK
jgi:hypothetical protein